MKKKIVNYLIANGDKSLHLLACMVIVMVVGKVLMLASCQMVESALLGVGTALSIGLLKEVIDANTGGKFDMEDAAFDVIGALVGVVLFSFMVI